MEKSPACNSLDILLKMVSYMSYKKILGIYISFFFFGLISWIVHTYGRHISLDQIVFHLMIGFDANAGAELPELWDLAKYIVIAPALCSAASIFIIFLIVRVANLKFEILSYLLIISTIIYSLNKINIIGFVKSFWGEDYFSAVYVEPVIEDYKPPSLKRNLILIYVESLERSIANLNGVSPIQPIEDLNGMIVPKFYQAPGTNWSIAGMISSQCSIPLKSFYGNKANKYATKEFLPKAVCLSDVLNSNGYYQVFMVGPDLKFAGMDKFYSSHKFDQMLGRDELRKIIDNEIGFYGYGQGPNDDVLFDAAYSVAQDRVKESRPFNLTIITTDNHFPYGFPSPNCETADKNAGLLGTYNCTSRILRTFVDRLAANKAFYNTDIVILGDHLFMANDKQVNLFGAERSIYFKYISNTPLPKFKRSEMTHFDVAPTILHALGFSNNQVESFGLGQSVFNEIPDPNFIRSRLDERILNRSKVYDSFWGIKN